VGILTRIWQIPDLKKRILFTLGMLAIFRIGIFVTLPGVDRASMRDFFTSADAAQGFLGIFNAFSGNAIMQLSVFALGIMPYISASIIFQLLTVVIPTLDRLNKEGEQGRKRINMWTRYATIILASFQGYFIATYLESIGQNIVLNPGLPFRLMAVLTLTTGTAFIMWLGEQISERGIGNGMSVIIFAGIVSGLPNALIDLNNVEQSGLFLLLALIVAVVLFIVSMEKAEYRIDIQYAKRMVGNQVGTVQNTHLPLRLNMAGVIPPIFASTLLAFPAALADWINTDWMRTVRDSLVVGNWRYVVIFCALCIFFSFFYTAVMFNPTDVAENLKKNGGSVPGIRPGTQTAEYIDRILTRLTFAGALYIAFVCIIPMYVQEQFKVSFYFGGTSLLIVVSVALDTMQQIESYLTNDKYEALSEEKKVRIREGEAI
jgi:preprotein translocase subunit SecY